MKNTLILLTATGLSPLANSAVIARQDFETAPSTPTAIYTNTGTSVLNSGSTSGTSTPSNSTWGVGDSQGFTWTGDGRINFDAIDTTGYTNITATIRLAALSGTSGNGMDAADDFTVFVSPDNGATFYQRIFIQGSTANNAKWSFASATGTVSNTYAADNSGTSFQTVGSGELTGTDAPTTLEITGLPSVSQLVIRYVADDNSPNENWLVDDFVLTGDPVPEPSSTALLGLGGLALLARRRR